jgi:hypothetical protein
MPGMALGATNFCEAKSQFLNPSCWTALACVCGLSFFSAYWLFWLPRAYCRRTPHFLKRGLLAWFLSRFSLPVRYPFKLVSLVLVVMQLICRDGRTNESIVIAMLARPTSVKSTLSPRRRPQACGSTGSLSRTRSMSVIAMLRQQSDPRSRRWLITPSAAGLSGLPSPEKTANNQLTLRVWETRLPRPWFAQRELDSRRLLSSRSVRF